MDNKNHPLPKSATLFYIGLIGVLVYCITLYFLKKFAIDAFWSAIISICTVSLSMIFFEKLKLGKIHAYSSGINFSKSHKIDVKRVLIKLLGLYGTIGLAALYYWIFPEYRSDFYNSYFQLLKILLPILLIGSIPYFFVLDKYMEEPCDSYWHAGNFFLLRWKLIDKSTLKYHLLGWLVKVFFFALMFTFLINNTATLLSNDVPSLKTEFSILFEYIYNFLYSIDLLFVTAGYLLTLKILDSHIRTAEPTFFGWVIAVFCYQPFWGLISNSYINYDDSYFWVNMLADHQVIYILWGIVILLLIAVYVMATIVFGVRFSNLTNRGIITNGPYRFMKHPAYICKNISWWLISIPFISYEGFDIALKHSLLLLLLNFIYYLRAKTEERHLSLDPNYVQYATAMNERGVFKNLYRLLPFLKYDVNRYIKNGEIKKLYF